MYKFLTGFMFWVSISIFFIGLSVRFILYFKGLDWRLDRVAYKSYPFYAIKGALKSILKWIIPFLTHGWRKQSCMTIAFFTFHIGAVIVPFFGLAHNVFIRSKIGVSFFPVTLNQITTDVLSWLVIIGAVMLTTRRLILPQAKILTKSSDYFILFLSVAPFITGLCARYEVGNYLFWLYLHIICGEALLIAAPFTKLSHIVLFFASRAQLGMDYGIKRGGMKSKKGINW
ncbi:MAG: respiratory nitrate reductase subunit gamma [Deltaproteobacteria bacterium]|nr:respiratory nitrate reductase subunit gamma [Deltaproteobacteria bacterium]